MTGVEHPISTAVATVPSHHSICFQGASDRFCTYCGVRSRDHSPLGAEAKSFAAVPPQPGRWDGCRQQCATVGCTQRPGVPWYALHIPIDGPAVLHHNPSCQLQAIGAECEQKGHDFRLKAGGSDSGNAFRQQTFDQALVGDCPLSGGWRGCGWGHTMYRALWGATPMPRRGHLKKSFQKSADHPRSSFSTGSSRWQWLVLTG
jgi:hypothetical protein